MKKIVILLLMIPVLVSAQNKSKLFNGQNLEGWEVYGTEKWTITEGLLNCESGPEKGYGYLATKQSFKDFDLTLKFKPEANGNSGVFFHSSIVGTKVAGFQAEVAPPGHFSGGIYESYKRGWLIKPKKDRVKMAKWNKMRILVKGNTVSTWINGVQMIHLVDEAIDKESGKIALQIHDGGGIKVSWKDIFIKQL
jgi:Domain of Unknown Function (DUF1080)